MSAQTKTRTITEILARRAAGVSPTKAETVRLDAHFAAQIEGADGNGITALSIQSNIAAGMTALANVFFELETRVRGDNGKLYPVGANLPDGVETDGEIVDVNKHQFMQTQLLKTTVWKLETMFENCNDRIRTQRAKVKQAAFDLDRGRSGMTDSMLDRMADFLETLIDQQAWLKKAYASARECYEDLTGEIYESAALRAEREALQDSKPSASRSDRLKKLGC